MVEGNTRLLRGVSWLKLVEGARVQEGDVLDLADRAQAQIELYDGGAFSVSGPAMLYLAALPVRDGKATGSAELALERGWMKLALHAPRFPVRLRTPRTTIEATDAILVVASDGDDRIFVESGSARLGNPSKKRGDVLSEGAKAGEFWMHENGKNPLSSGRPPASFVSAMPRIFMDPLPTRAELYRATRIDGASVGEVSFAEAERWLAGPYRPAFLKRFRSRLSDATFRRSVEANLRGYPEWDRILHPEKFQPKPAPGTSTALPPARRESAR